VLRLILIAAAYVLALNLISEANGSAFGADR